MTKYLFDGTKLKYGAKTIANVKRNVIYHGDGATVIGNIKGNNIRLKNGSTVIFNIKGDDIRQGSGSLKIATMKDVDKEIKGPGKITKAALWVLCCR
jgi:hypothetical protein